MTRTIRVGALQLRAHDRRDFAERKPALFERIEAAARDVDLLVVPEATMPAYVLEREPIDAAEMDDAAQTLARIARSTQTTIVAGIALKTGSGVANAALVADRDGTIAGRAEKIFLWHFDRKWFAPGDRIAPVRTSIGSIGALICADGRMPEIAAALADEGAELLAMPTAWVTSGRDPGALENVQADLLARVRAWENGIPFVAANKCGVELGMVAYCGKSQIVDADGRVIALASETDESCVTASVEIGAGTRRRAERRTIAPRAEPAEDAARVAIALDLPDDIDARLATLDASYALAPGSTERLDAFDAAFPLARVSARQLADPHALVDYRLAGYRIAIVENRENDPWFGTIARARALELRMYVFAFDRAEQRAFAVDPDGAVIAGTFGDYGIASFAIDLRRTRATSVAPGTDVAEGLARVRSLLVHEVAL